LAVRKRVDVAQAEQNNATDKRLASLLSRIDEEVEFKTQECAAEIGKRALKEWLKGLMAFPVAIAGGFLMWWSSTSDGFHYWLGTISGLAIMSVSVAYCVELIKLLISGDLTKDTAALMKEFAMKEWTKVFLAFVSILGGLTLSIAGFLNGRNRWGQFDLNAYDAISIFIGIVLMAGGITSFLTRSKSYKGRIGMTKD
jgi:hypothetical protein